MLVHHLNCGTMCPLGGRFLDGESFGLGPAKLVCHCLLIESDDGLILIDTGLGLQDVENPSRRLSLFFRNLLRLQLQPEETAAYQITKRGFRLEDVRHIILTHLDFDHAGGIEDFPNALVHVYLKEFEAAHQRKGLIARRRYRPQQWDANIRWRLISAQGESWYGFRGVRVLEGVRDDILLVPLVGHTFGHCGVAVPYGSGYLLHAGDAYFYRDELSLAKHHCTPGLRAYQRMMEVDRRSRLLNQERLRQLKVAAQGAVTIVSAHDRMEFEECLRFEQQFARAG